MSKVYSSCLLLTLVFSSAHAPTFDLLRNLPFAATDESAASPASLATFSAASDHATYGTAHLSAAAQREFAEDDDIKRFQLDELYLPNLDVSLPELFDWHDIERSYLADAGLPPDRVGVVLDSFRGVAFMSANRGGGSGFGLAPASGMIGSVPSAPGATGVEPIATDADTSGSASKSDSSPSGSDAGDSTSGDTAERPSDPIYSTLPPVNETPPLLDIDREAPVPVPAPGALGLFALGLAGLQLAGRKKKQKRLAAS